MDFSVMHKSLIGEWAGSNLLRLNWLTPSTTISPSRLSVVPVAWVDSWHQSGMLMFCYGAIDQDGTIALCGSYEAPPGQDWGWRIVINAKSNAEMQIAMYDCTSEGEEELAVQADHTRIAL
jgi:hypothetical protein